MIPPDLHGGGQGPAKIRYGSRYCLSQRAAHISEEVSGEHTVSGRPMINTRDEPHADSERFRRLHVIVGDSNMAEMVATYLKVGTTALVLDMVEDGFFDLSCQKRVERQLTPRHFARCVASRTNATQGRPRVYGLGDPARLPGGLPRRTSRHVGGDAGAREVLARWGQVLTQLAQDPMAVSHPKVHWAIKKTMIDRYRAKYGCSLEDPRVGLLDLQYHDIVGGSGTLQPPRAARRSRAAGSGRIRSSVPGSVRPRPRERACVATSSAEPNLRGFEYQVDWAYVRTLGPESETILCRDPFVAHDQRVERLAA